MNMQDKEVRAQSRAICEAATPGEWAITGSKSHLIDSKPEEKYGIVSIVCEVWNNIDANATFIAHARTALPAALDYIEQLETSLEEARANAYKEMSDRINEEKNAAAYFRYESDKRQERIEILENAVHGKCDFCVNQGNNAICCKCYQRRRNFVFDQARFSDKPTPCQDEHEAERNNS